MIPREYSKFIGIPFKTYGRTLSGADCWGIVRLFFQQERGITLPNYLNVRDLTKTFERVKLSGQWTQLQEPKKFAAVLMNRHVGDGLFAPIHIGVMVNDMMLLHVDENDYSRIVKISSPSVASRIDSFWEYTC